MAEFSNSNTVIVAAGENLPLTENAVKDPAGSDQSMQSALQGKLWRQYRHSHRRHCWTHFRGAGCRR